MDDYAQLSMGAIVALLIIKEVLAFVRGRNDGSPRLGCDLVRQARTDEQIKQMTEVLRQVASQQGALTDAVIRLTGEVGILRDRSNRDAS